MPNFLSDLHQKVTQDIKNTFEYAHLNTKIHEILSDTLWNSKNVTKLVLVTSKAEVFLVATTLSFVCSSQEQLE